MKLLVFFFKLFELFALNYIFICAVIVEPWQQFVQLIFQFSRFSIFSKSLQQKLFRTIQFQIDMVFLWFITQLLRSLTSTVKKLNVHQINCRHFAEKIKEKRGTTRYTCLKLSPKKNNVRKEICAYARGTTTNQYYLVCNTARPHSHTHSIPITIC